MHKVENTYRPDEVEFTVETSQVPSSLGKFKTDKEARVFMSENLLTVQSKITTERFMDQCEIEGLRDQYSDELENNLPSIKAEHFKKIEELERAKQNEKDAKEMVNSSLNKIQQLANEVNDRTTEIELDPAFTWEVVYNGKRFYYTYIDKEIKLAAIRDIPSYEMEDLISSSDKNEEFFIEKLKVVNE
ncbi:hypothetical protein [Aquimarina sp. 2201CG5-10]|uniref:hypothetical protein n=1 Tax=Aquimarina callyspongiae TaxID=3098150 RepID=UPI002AB37C70|nr:hypothetical protein [Aquimarina sp. 2201CG5-10]MDY8137601.1 hypothetical protein [Aquimarina sp. 2201CG5-10]